MFSTGIAGQPKLPLRCEIKLNGVKAEVASSGTKNQHSQKVGQMELPAASNKQQAAGSRQQKTFGAKLKSY